MNNYIDGDFFESLGDGKNIVYRDTDNAETAFETAEQHKALITHNSDRAVDEDMYAKFRRCGKYDMWFAQNIACVHDDLRCLPIGLERRRWCPFSKFDVMMECKSEFAGNPKRTLYGNFSLGNNWEKRTACLNAFKNKDFCTNKIVRYLPFVKTLTPDMYRNFCMELLDHRFVLCPEGNGIDTHRMWETLYLGRIPVVLHNAVNDSFKGLPILILDRWEDFDNRKEDFLAHTDINAGYQLLTQEYWKKTISEII